MPSNEREGAGHTFPPQFQAVAWRLYEAWLGASDPAVRGRLLAEVPVPGPVALRARFFFLTDVAGALGEPADLSISLESWFEQLSLETEGDSALVAHDIKAARTAFSALVNKRLRLHDRVASVHGLIGLGDAARQNDEADVAFSSYEQALSAAETIPHRFGIVRALVPLGHLAMSGASATEARELFGRAEEISAELDERLYLTNALIGKGEALQRLHETDQARAVLRQALEVAEALGSNVAIANAAQRLADLELRLGERSEAGPLLGKAAAAFEAAGVAIGAATATALHAELLLAERGLAEAAAQYLRAYELSRRAGYPRGQAGALAGLARCAEASSDHPRAAKLQAAALDTYESLDDLVGRTKARAGLARAAAGAGRLGKAVEQWLLTLDGIEQMRAMRDRLELQEEYRLRFGESYSGALLATIAAEDAEAFVTVFESLAGRRLAGLLEDAGVTSGDAELLGQLLTRADQRTFHQRRPAEPTRDDKVRRLGAAALRFGLLERAGQTFENEFAAAYRPFDRARGGELLRELSPTAEALLLAPIPARGDLVGWLWRTAEGEAKLGRTVLSNAAQTLLARIGSAGGAGDLRGQELAPLRELLPVELRRRLATGERTLLLLPLDRLWSVPWPAIPLDARRFVGEVAPLVLAPSLSVAVTLGKRPSAIHAKPRTVLSWRSPAISRHQLEPVFVEDAAWDHRPLSTARRARQALLKADPEPLVVIACHGRPIAALGHYLELEPGEPLTPADVLAAKGTPEELVLISCWGAVTPEGRSGDLLTIATFALARGTFRVAASIGEMGDTYEATRFVHAFLHRLRDRPMPVALRDATARLLEADPIRQGLLRNWSPLVVVGSL